MLSEGADLYGVVVDGYWCDIGNNEAYADCHFDILSGKADIDIGKMQAEGYWIESEIAEGVILEPPVYIGKNVRISRGAVIGPYAVVGSNSSIGSGATVEYSVLNGANILRGAEIRGAVLCTGSTIGCDVVISEGCVIGENSQVEDSVSLSPGVKVWPGLRVKRGGSGKWSIYSEHGGRGELPFASPGELKGDLTDLSPEICLRIGFALGSEGVVAMGCGPGKKQKRYQRRFPAVFDPPGQMSLEMTQDFSLKLPLQEIYMEQQCRYLLKKQASRFGYALQEEREQLHHMISKEN